MKLKQILSFLFLWLIPVFVLSAETNPTLFGELKNTASSGGYTTADVTQTTPATIAGQLTFGALGLLGVIFMVLIIYAGYLWMTAAGDSKPVEKAKSIVQAAVIGLALVLGALVFTSFLFDVISGQYTNKP